jgi:regulation of enolase protein 1 (concanavalin A-like superfamily)
VIVPPRKGKTGFLSRKRSAFAVVGAVFTVAAMAAAPAASAAGSGPVSDDFSAASLNSSLWTVTDHAGDGTVTTTGTGTTDARLALSVPGGAPHDAWASNSSLDVMQPISDADFAVEAKFDSVPTKKYQDEGVLVQQDASNWERFSLYSDGSKLYAFGASTVGATSTQRLKVAVAAGTSLWLRVARQGSTFTMSYSPSGSSWQTIGSFSQALTASTVGVYAANAQPTASAAAPAFTSLVDYFFNQTSPISPEDGTGGGGDTTPPQISAVSASPTSTGATINWTTDEASTGQVDYGTSASYGGTVTQASSTVTHTVTLSGLVSGVTYHYQVTATDAASNSAHTGDRSFTTAQGGGPGGPVSDDFSATPLDTSRWSVVNPVGDGSVTMSGQGTADARLLLTLPSGTAHDAFQTDAALRVMQPVSDTDFGIEAKFDSIPSKKYQDQGLLVQQDASTWMRFDAFSDGSKLNAYAATTAGNVTTQQLKATVTATGAMRLRVSRTGSSWQFQYAPSATSAFQTIGTVTDALTVSTVGVYAGNSGSPAPAWQSLVDYFFNTASPISPEDGQSGGGDTTPPAISQVAVQPSTSSAVVTWKTDELSTGSVDYGASSSYGQSAASPASSTNHTATLSGLASGSTYHYSVTAVDGSGNTASTSDATFTTTQSSGNSGPVITVWYGSHQTFGTFAQPQNWANLLGNVSDTDGVQSLTYSLNGASAKTLTMGPDTRRLQYKGDFNADIAWSSLAAGDNTVSLRAVDNLGNASTAQVTLTLANGSARSLPFTVNWSASTPLNDQAQVVDGNWAVDSKGLHIQQPGYDRLVDIGSKSLKDFVVSVPVTVYGFGPDAYKAPSNEPLVGFGLRWQGHTKVDNAQPVWGWYPTGALAWFRWYKPTTQTEMRGNNNTPDVKKAASMTLGVKYMLKAQAQTQASGSTVYSLKMWPASGSEPSAWNQQITVTGGPATGSIILIAHQVDAAFGSVTVTAIP